MISRILKPMKSIYVNLIFFLELNLENTQKVISNRFPSVITSNPLKALNKKFIMKIVMRTYSISIDNVINFYDKAKALNVHKLRNINFILHTRLVSLLKFHILLVALILARISAQTLFRSRNARNYSLT
jgi:hypothetical protein